MKAKARVLVKAAVAADPAACLARSGVYSLEFRHGRRRPVRVASKQVRRVVMRCVAESVAGVRTLKAAARSGRHA